MPVYGLGAIRAMPPYSWCFADWNAELPKDKVKLAVIISYVYRVALARREWNSPHFLPISGAFTVLFHSFSRTGAKGMVYGEDNYFLLSVI